MDQYTLHNIDINQTKAKLWRQLLLDYGAFIIALFIISIYLSTALAIILSVLLGLLWLITAQFQLLPQVLKSCPVAKWAVLLYLCFIAGLCYGDAPSVEAYSMLRKYRELLFIPLLSCFFTNERYRLLAWKAFIIGSVLTLLISYLMDFGIMDLFRHKTYTLKSRITHSIFIAFFMFFCAHKAFDDRKHMHWFLLLFIFGIYNLFFVVDGRTGQLVFVLLVPLFAVQRLGKKELLFVSAIFAVFLLLYVNFSDKSARIYEGVTETQDYLNHTHKITPTSMGIRYTFWENSMKLVSEKPWLGHGTGSFGGEYRRITDTKEAIKNPHNEFLLIAVQFGIFGFVVHSGFLFCQYYSSRRLHDSEKWLAQGLLLTLFITSLLNSPILDHSEGHWFAVMIALLFAPNMSLRKHD